MLKDYEELIINIYRELDVEGRISLIRDCMNEKDAYELRKMTAKKKDSRCKAKRVGNGKVIDFNRG